MPSFIRGPFIEYECTNCGCTVQENAPSSSERIPELNAMAEKRVCAACYEPPWASAVYAAPPNY